MVQPASSNLFRRIFVDNFGLKLFSLLIVLILWLYVQGAGEQSITIEVPLTVDIAEDKVLVSDVPTTVKLTVTGTWAAVKSWDYSRLRANLDMRQARPGPTVQYLEEDVFRLPPGIRIARITPSKLTLNFASKATKQITVIPQVKGKPAPGFIVKGFVVKPEEIDVSGAEGDLLYLSEILTEEIDVQNRRQSFSTSVIPLRLSKNIEFPKKTSIDVEVKIERDLIEKDFKNIPIQVVKISHEYVITPKTVDIKLSGPRNLVESFDVALLRAEVVGTEGEGDVPGEYKREIHFKDLPKAILDYVKQTPSVYLAKLVIKNKLLPGGESRPANKADGDQAPQQPTPPPQ